MLPFYPPELILWTNCCCTRHVLASPSQIVIGYAMNPWEHFVQVLSVTLALAEQVRLLQSYCDHGIDPLPPMG